MKNNLNFIVMWIVCGIVSIVGMVMTKDIECMMILAIPAFVSFWSLLF